ncbi:MAG TPA: SprT family zinc-dependent metalloprotease [Candidatus Kapabacteria bacterium]|jgi:predicted metal-dependent hydrolase|nr:SprT family zinc-dependent metalloprotease [Candidatus Kapabacteria bacterium]HPP40517.1 SprT family zinc-dependent metalloprotease [Candidatus Kapabacteria bacterium]HPU24340.1 SprT family zinc-dependent metalloprotease [Candidatus Kapabacteria bacterium]
MQIEIFKIIRSNRKTIALKIDNQSNLIVKAPLSVPFSHLLKIVKQKQNWIIAKKIEVQNRKKFTRNLSDGSKITIFGKDYFMNYVENFEFALQLKNNQILVASDLSKHIKPLLRQLIIKIAKDYFHLNVAKWASIMQLQYNRISIKNTVSRWGSCSSLGNLNFNWKLAFAPLEVIDYIIIHELSHLRHLNHSADFWNEVRKYCPEYKKHKKWLKDNALLLEL